MSNHIDHYEALFDSNYLRWFDLDGADKTVTITKVERDVELTMRGGVKSRKPVIHFKEFTKPLVMNKTNMSSIALIHGKKPSQWTGKQVVLFESTTEMFDPDLKRLVTRECIRIRAAAKKITPEYLDPDSADRQRQERLIGLKKNLEKYVNPEMANVDLFATWCGVLLGIAQMKKEDLKNLTMEQIEQLEKAFHSALESKENANG